VSNSDSKARPVCPASARFHATTRWRGGDDLEGRSPAALAEEDAYQLLVDALDLYRREHKNLPARVPTFKTSRHNAAELAGFQQAIADRGVDSFDLLSVGSASAKLFRRGAYPPLRGTLLTLDDREQIPVHAR
jgi:hypothetical protein